VQIQAGRALWVLECSLSTAKHTAVPVLLESIAMWLTHQEAALDVQEENILQLMEVHHAQFVRRISIPAFQA
jgi:hypothetical protein